MNLRKLLLSRRDFAHDGVTITEDAWQHRQESMTAELIADIPTLRRLRASKIEFSYQLEDSRIEALIYLTETPQLNLIFGKRLDAQNDIYLQDLENISHDQKKLLESYEQAHKSTVDPTQDARTQELRKRMVEGQKSGYVHVHTGIIGDAHALDSLPKYLPNSRQFKIKAKVLGLRIGIVEIVLESDVRVSLDDQLLFQRNTKIRIHRSEVCRIVAVGTLLQIAMDQKTVISLTIVVEQSWVDGRPNRVTLLNILTE